MSITIVGNSAAAVGAIEAIREYDADAPIRIISAEGPDIYSRPLISHYVGGEIDRRRLAYRGPSFYQDHNVDALFHEPVIAIDRAGHTVTTSEGHTASYDKLLLAVGGTPIVPPMPGLDLEGVTTFASLADAQAIENLLEQGRVRRAVVVGGGMIGIKATDALTKRGVRVTMVELAPRILIRALDDESAAMLTRLFERVGVRVLTENTVAEIIPDDGHIAGVVLQDGQRLDCDLLVFGIGVRPNAGLARDAGLEVNRGVVVDRGMRTSDPDIYAAGDVAEAYDLVVDLNRTVAIWPNAYRQGAIAGAQMLGQPRHDQGGIPMNAIEVAGVPCVAIGSGNAEGDGYEVLTKGAAADTSRSQPQYRRLVLEGNRLVGVILVGNISRAGIYTGLIRHRVDISAHRDSLLSDRLSLLSVPEEYRKHVVRGESIEV
ncbi:MAG: NAD(P)/FAD-dependent oxidoreductase [Anaerolineae bacterium]